MSLLGSKLWVSSIVKSIKWWIRNHFDLVWQTGTWRSDIQAGEEEKQRWREGGWPLDFTSATTAPQGPPGHGNHAHPHPQCSYWSLRRNGSPPLSLVSVWHISVFASCICAADQQNSPRVSPSLGLICLLSNVFKVRALPWLFNLRKLKCYLLISAYIIHLESF